VAEPAQLLFSNFVPDSVLRLHPSSDFFVCDMVSIFDLGYPAQTSHFERKEVALVFIF
jgi:hypothetical protein